MSQEQCHELVETAIGDPAEQAEHHNRAACGIGKPVFDGTDVTASFFHIPADALEVFFQLNDTGFHIDFSIGFFADIEFSLLLIGRFFCG